MQERQQNRRQYFNELATTSKKYFIPYIQKFKNITPETQILEIGCGDGGNLLPFSRMGCHVVGCDMAECRIDDAKRFFEEEDADGEFIASDVFLLKNLEHQFDIIICHDVIEHISDKTEFMSKCKTLLKRGGDFHVISRMADALWRTPANLQEPSALASAVHSPFAHVPI